MSTLRFAPGVPGLESLGASAPEDFLEAFGAGAARLVTGDRIEPMTGRGAEVVARLPLPGTPDRSGVQRESPRGAGTGMLVLRVWREGPRERLRARLTEPRSTSQAARRWNLVCHLVANGVGAPALVAMGEARNASFLIERELDGFEALSAVAARELKPRRRRRIVRSVGKTLGALFRCGAWLPELSADDILIQRDPLDGSHEGADTCAALEIQDLQAEREALHALAVRRTRLPGVAVADVRRGRLLAHVSTRRRNRLLTSLARDLPLTPRERLEVAALTRGAGADRGA